MSRKPKGSIWDYLKSLPGLLERGDKGEIATAKQRYWRVKNREYQKARRTKLKEVKVCFNTREWKEVEEAAKYHKKAPSNLIRQCSLAYVSQTFVVPDILTIRKMEAEFLRALTGIERIAAKEKLSLFGRSDDYEQLKALVEDMRTVICKELTQPNLLLQVIASNPNMWDEIKKIIR